MIFYQNMLIGKVALFVHIPGVHLEHCHPFINSYKGTPSILIQDLYSIEDNEYISRYYWLNWNQSWAKQNPKPGQIFEFSANSISYFTAREQHRLSVYRTIRQLWRLVYPTNIECIGFDENIVSPLDKPIISLRTGEQFNNFAQYYNSLGIKSISKEEWELRVIALIDAENIELLLNRNGRINCTSYPPLCMLLDTFNKLTQEQQLALMPFIKTKPKPL